MSLDEKLDLKPREAIGVGVGLAVALGGAIAAGSYPLIGGYTSLAGSIGAIGACLPHAYRVNAASERVFEGDDAQRL